MELLTASMLEALSSEKKRQFDGLLPGIIKRLIIAGTVDLTGLRFPSGDDIWAPGFDGVVVCEKGNRFVGKGTSVWECGNSAYTLRKINDDYKKRTKDSLGIDTSQTNFYLVFPKTWPYKKSITQWESEHQDWKAVHVYDASILCDWINSEPTVVSWILEELFNRNVDFSGINQAWNLFSKKTNPAFSVEMFIEDRENEINTLNKSLSQSIIKVKSESFIDSVGFVLGALTQNQKLQDKCIVVYDATTYKTISRIVKNKVIILNYVIVQDIIPTENSVIVCYNKEATSIEPDIQLKPYSKMHYYSAFKKMGIKESESHELYAFCHGNLRALIRRIPGIANEHKPEWSGIEGKKLLEPIVFLRTINICDDRELVEQIAGTSFEDVEEFYKSLLLFEDSPIKRVDNNYLIVNYEEAWSVLGCNVNDGSFNRFHLSVKWFLRALLLEGLYSERFGTVHMIKQHFRNLVLNYVYYSFSSSDLNILSKAVNEILQFALEDQVSFLIIENLAAFAEAAPLTVLEFLEKNLKDKSKLLSLFSSDNQQHEYTGILSAFDELTLHRQTSVNACKNLFSLYQMGFEYKIVNSPIESLLTALCLYNKDVALTIKQKEELIRFFNRIDTYNTCILICRLLGKDYYCRSERYGKRNIDVKNELTIQEVLDVSEKIASIAFDFCVSHGDVYILQELLKNYNRFQPAFLENMINQFSATVFYDKDLIPIVFQLKERSFLIQRGQMINERPYLFVLKSWADILLSVCSEDEQDDWLFYKTHECPTELLLAYNDYSEIKAQERQIRIDKLKDIKHNNGIEGIIRLIKRMENNKYWGSVLSEVINNDSLQSLVDAIVHDEKFALLGGLIDAISAESAQIIYSMIPSELRVTTLAFISREDSVSFFKTEEEKEAFWTHKDMFIFSEECFSQLLIYNPWGLLFYTYEQMKKEPIASIEIAEAVINSIASNKIDSSYRIDQNEYYIIEIVKIIDSLCYSDEWAATTLQLYTKGFVREMPLSSKRFFFHNPHKLVEFLSSDSSTYYSEQWKFALPNNACDEYDSLIYFVETLVKYDYGCLAGRIIGRIPGGEDGVRICEKIRELLECVDNQEVDNGVKSGILFSKEVRTITDGMDQRILSEKYEKDACELEVFYPHSASILRELSQFYLSMGEQDYLDSELLEY